MCQDTFFQFMAAHRVQQRFDFESKFNALCEANGVKLRGKDKRVGGRNHRRSMGDGGYDVNDVRARQAARRARKMKNYKPLQKVR